MRPLQNQKKVVILSIAKNLNILNGNYLQILHKLLRFAQDDIFQNDKIKSFAKVLKYLRYFLFLFFLFFSFQGKSQLMDNIHVCLQAPPKPMIKLNNRGSFVANKPAFVTGIVLGLSFNKRLKFGLGYNQVISRIHKDYFLDDYLGNPVDTFNSTLKLLYVSGYAEYVYFYKKHWEISIPIQFGAGVSRYSYKARDKTYYTDNRFGFIYEATTDIVYKPVNWLGFGVGFGYRILLFNETEIIRQFSSPIYSFGIKLYLSPVYRAVFPKNDG